MKAPPARSADAEGSFVGLEYEFHLAAIVSVHFAEPDYLAHDGYVITETTLLES